MLSTPRCVYGFSSWPQLIIELRRCSRFSQAQQWLPIQYISPFWTYESSISLFFLLLYFFFIITNNNSPLYYHSCQFFIIFTQLLVDFSNLKNTNTNKTQKPVYSTKSTIRLISTLPKLPPWTNFPMVTRKCTAVAGNLVHFLCVMDLTWLITRRLGTMLVL